MTIKLCLAMDSNNFRTIIYNAAKDGKLESLRVFLGGRPTDWLDNCLNDPSESTPPLVIAARYGNAECVEYLVHISSLIKQLRCVFRFLRVRILILQAL